MAVLDASRLLLSLFQIPNPCTVVQSPEVHPSMGCGLRLELHVALARSARTARGHEHHRCEPIRERLELNISALPNFAGPDQIAMRRPFAAHSVFKTHGRARGTSNPPGSASYQYSRLGGSQLFGNAGPLRRSGGQIPALQTRHWASLPT